MKQHCLSLWNQKLRVLMALIFLASIFCNNLFADDCGDLVPLGYGAGEHPQSGSFGNYNNTFYVDNEDGTTTDNNDVSNVLMWSTEGSPVAFDDQGAQIAYDFVSACYYCETYKEANLTNWRLPTIFELESIIDSDYGSPTINSNYFTSQAASYWSASVPEGLTDMAWGVSFSDGTTSLMDKTVPMMVRCVLDKDDITEPTEPPLTLIITAMDTDENTGGSNSKITDMNHIGFGVVPGNQITFKVTKVLYEDDTIPPNITYKWTKAEDFGGSIVPTDFADKAYIALVTAVDAIDALYDAAVADLDVIEAAVATAKTDAGAAAGSGLPVTLYLDEIEDYSDAVVAFATEVDTAAAAEAVAAADTTDEVAADAAAASAAAAKTAALAAQIDAVAAASASAAADDNAGTNQAVLDAYAAAVEAYEDAVDAYAAAASAAAATTDSGANVFISDNVPGTYTFTVDVWDDSYPRAHGQQTVTFTICETADCLDVTSREEYASSFIMDTATLILPYLSIKKTITDEVGILTAVDLEFVLVPDPTGTRILFALRSNGGEETKDMDGDGYTYDGTGLLHPGEKDCNDDDPRINPGAQEIYGNGVNEDCVPTDID